MTAERGAIIQYNLKRQEIGKIMEFNATFLVTIISFIVFVFLMNKILYAPVLNIMEERNNFVNGNYNSANENDAKSEELINQKEEKLSDAKNEARGKYIEALNGYKNKKSEMVAEAQNSAKDELEQAKADLQRLSDDVKNGLKASMTDLANDIVEKVIGYRSDVNGFDDNAVNEVLWGKG